MIRLPHPISDSPALCKQSDCALLELFKVGQCQEAFSELVRRHLDLVYASCRRQLRDAHLAEDAAQAVFLLLARKAKSLDGSVILAGWLHNTARYVCANAARTRAIRGRHEMQAAHEKAAIPLADPIDPDLESRLDQALTRLPSADRDAIFLRFFQGLSLEQVSRALSISQEAARKRLSRAIEKLRHHLTPAASNAPSASAVTALIGTSAAPAPPSLLAAITTTHSSAAAISLAKGALIMMTISKAKLVAGIALLVFLLGGTVALVLRPTPPAPASRSSPSANPAPAAITPQEASDPLLPPAIFRTGPLNAADRGTISGIVLTPDGAPLPNTMVCLSTANSDVPIYSIPPRTIQSATTDAQGRFSLPAGTKDRAIIVCAEQGYAQETMAELAADGQVMLQAWASVEGILRVGKTPMPNQVIHLSRTRFGSKVQHETYRTLHDMITRTDAIGHYRFPEVAPGDTWISWRTDKPRTYDLQYRYVDLKPGQAMNVDIGGQGRAITGRVQAADSNRKLRFYGSVWPFQTHAMRRPANWASLATPEQDALTAAWEKTPDAKLFDQEQCPIDFDVNADGSFTVPDLTPGRYRVVTCAWTGAPAAAGSRIVAYAAMNIMVPPLVRMDQPQDIGMLTASLQDRLEPGDIAPEFEVVGLDGRPLRLADFKGKYVLLHFWNSTARELPDQLTHLKAAQSAHKQDDRLVLVGLSSDLTILGARSGAAANQMSWKQGFIGQFGNLPQRYRIRIPAILLIGPDGKVIHPALEGPEIQAAVDQELGK